MPPDRSAGGAWHRLRGWAGGAALLLGACAAAAVSPADHPALGAFIETMVQRHGFDAAELRRLFAAAQRRPDIIDAMERPREALPWYAYRRGFVTEERARLGARFWKRHRQALARAERDYGVPPEVVVAIIGVETRYGTYAGRYSVLDALVTLTLDYPPRRDFFRRELEEFLLLARELGLDPLAVKGSYAGALGIPQFIPSSYRAYAVDFDRDGRRDLFASTDDAIGSVARFLQHHGWANGEPVIESARIEAASGDRTAAPGVEPVVTLREWVDRGVIPNGGAAANGSALDRAAALITLEGESGPLYHLGYNNFYVITRYNRSQNYAMAVHELARMIRQRYDTDS